MWVAQFKIRHEGCWIIPRTLKYDIEEFGYTLNMYEEKGNKYHTNISWIRGCEKEKRKFFRSLRNDPHIVKYHIKGNQLYTLVRLDTAVAHIFDRSLFFVRPVRTYKGFEYWELGSWNKTLLMKFYRNLTAFADVHIVKMRREFPTVYIQHYLSNLTDRQAKALEYALARGYYDFPKKVSVKRLAKDVHTPRTTFHNTLRRAESKVMKLMMGDWRT
jgi:predicted DNA binding protein